MKKKSTEIDEQKGHIGEYWLKVIDLIASREWETDRKSATFS